jgi:hypothetical protein
MKTWLHRFFCGIFKEGDETQNIKKILTDSHGPPLTLEPSRLGFHQLIHAIAAKHAENRNKNTVCMPSLHRFTLCVISSYGIFYLLFIGF